MGLKIWLGEIDDKPDKYAKDFMKIWFESISHLPLNKPLTFHALILIIRCVFKKGNECYPQIFLDECLYEL